MNSDYRTAKAKHDRMIVEFLNNSKIKSCMNCQFDQTDILEIPCKNCEDHRNWERKESSV